MMSVMFLLMTLTSGCRGYQEQRFAMEPQDQSAILGSRVTLPCRVENKVGVLQWTKNDFGLGNLNGYERYRMIKSDEERNYSLDIKDVKLEDDARYQCQVRFGINGELVIRSRYAQLNILVAPEPPRIIQGAFIDATEDQPVDIECVSVGGKPAAEITWVDCNQAVTKKNVKNKIELLPDGQRFTTRSVLRLTPNKEYHNRTLTCQAQNTADRAYRIAMVHLKVKYAPKLKVSIKSGDKNGKIPEGSEVRIRCDVDANPPTQIYRWFINDNPVIGDYADEMIIFNVTRRQNKTAVKCQVSNSIGKSEEKIKLEVTYPPSFRTRPQDIEADFGSSVILSCDVDGHPDPEIRWLHTEPGHIGQVKGKSSNLKVLVSNETAGRYICKANVEGYPEIESDASIFIKSAPKILSNRTQFGTEGESVRIECAALCVPKPSDIRWYLDGREMRVIVDPDYAILEESLSDGIKKSTLMIRASKSHHYGQYNCCVTNEYGNANAAILLKPIKTLPLFIILVEVTSGIVFFSTFIISVVLLHRRRRSSEKPDVTVTTGDMCKDSDLEMEIKSLTTLAWKFPTPSTQVVCL